MRYKQGQMGCSIHLYMESISNHNCLKTHYTLFSRRNVNFHTSLLASENWANLYLFLTKNTLNWAWWFISIILVLPEVAGLKKIGKNSIKSIKHFSFPLST